MPEREAAHPLESPGSVAGNGEDPDPESARHRGTVGPDRGSPSLSTVVGIVTDAADEVLAGVVAGGGAGRQKDDGSLVTAIDDALQRRIGGLLEAAWPGIPLLGEEMSHHQQAEILARGADRFWVLDPLDGTTNFVAGFPFYGISLALVADGGAELAVVHDPVRGETFSAARGAGAFLNDAPLAAAPERRLGQCVANVDYKRLTRSVVERLVRCPPFRSQRNLGSCVLEWCWLAADRFQLYLHGGQKLWDYAAGALILEESGGALGVLEGPPLDCRSLAKRPIVAASAPGLYAAWSEWLHREARPPRGPGAV